MASPGTNVDKLGSVNAVSLTWLGSRWNRIVAAPDHVMEQLAYIKAMKNAGLKALMCFDADAYRHFGQLDDPATWRQAANWSKAVYGSGKQNGPLIDAIEPVNEPDGEGFESSRMPVWVVNGILEEFARTWSTGMTIVGCATVSGQVSYYTDVGLRTDLLDVISFHPYAQWTPASLTEMINRHAALGRMLWITEVGLNAPDDEQAEFLKWTMQTINQHPAVEVCTWFCAHAYGDWGLSRTDGSWKPAAYEFRRIAGPIDTPPPNPYVFVEGFKKWHDLEPELIGEPLANERNTGFGGWQIQPTDTGVLQWHEGDGHIFVTRDGRVFQWVEDWPASQEVPA